MTSNPNNNAGPVDEPPVVHFASKDTDIPDSPNMPAQRQYSNQTQDQIHQLSDTLGDSHLQSRRMSNFQFETISLPASRVSPAASVANSVHDSTPRSDSQTRSTASPIARSDLELGVLLTTITAITQPCVARSFGSYHHRTTS